MAPALAVLTVFAPVLKVSADTASPLASPVPEFGTTASPAPATIEPFHVENWMRPTVDFWKRIFTEYTSDQGLIHDSKYPGLIYEIVDARNLDDDQREDLIRRSKEKWNQILRSIHAKADRIYEFTAEELRVFKLFSKIDEPDKFLKASEKSRIRFQLGLKDRFIEAIIRSGRYLPEMERIFAEYGLPTELTRLPFVESSFQPFAKSKVGAAGIWQFMPATGAQYLTVNALVDERYDPIRSTRAAAELLKRNYQELKSWPLAVTAYNHGRGGMVKVVERTGTTDFRTLFEHYHGPSFGLASRNYYLSLLAAIEVVQDYPHYFGPLTRDKPSDPIEVALMDYVALPDLCQGLGLTVRELREANPTFGDAVLAGRLRLPAGYKLRLPPDWGTAVGGPRSAFWLGYSRIPEKLRYKRQLAAKM